MHRIGFHFPSSIVATVCATYGITLSSRGTVVTDGSLSSFRNPRTSRGLVLENREPEKDQITINTEARDAIRDLFPNIPDNDLNQIIKTAFQKGRKKVGTANELPLARRAQLAVVAHIRHVYTDYDKLLRSGGYHDARGIVEVPTLDKLIKWRGDDENGTKLLEDVIREVVVISDGEDSEDDDDDLVKGRDTSVEVISSNAFADHIQTRPVDYANAASISHEDLRHHSDDEPPSGYRYIPQINRRRQAPDKKKQDRKGFSRYQAWDQAVERYRLVPQEQRRSEMPPTSERIEVPFVNRLGQSDSQNFRPRTYDTDARPAPISAQAMYAPVAGSFVESDGRGPGLGQFPTNRGAPLQDKV